MTNEQIKYSIETGKLKLGNWAKFIHYGVVIAIFLLPVTVIFFFFKDYFEGNPKPFEGNQLWATTIVPSILGILCYLLQRNKLKFKSIETKLTRTELTEVIERVAKRLEWIPHIVDEKVIVAKTHPGFFSGSWREQITILFDRNSVLVNSICDPDKRPSMVSMGRNKRNVNDLIEEINKAGR